MWLCVFLTLVCLFPAHRCGCVRRTNHSQPSYGRLTLLVQRLGHSCCVCHEPTFKPWPINSTVSDLTVSMVSIHLYPPDLISLKDHLTFVTKYSDCVYPAATCRWRPALMQVSPLLRRLWVRTTSLWSQKEPPGSRRGCHWCGTELWWVDLTFDLLQSSI